MKNQNNSVLQFLEKNYSTIQAKRKQKDFKWQDVVDDLKAQTKLIVSSESLRSKFRRMEKKNSDFTDKEKNCSKTTNGKVVYNYSAKEDLTKGTSEITQVVDKEIKTLEDLIEVCKIDTTIWNIDKYVANSWGNPNNQQWQVKAFLSKKKSQAKSLQEQFIEFLDNYNIKVLNPSVNKQVSSQTASKGLYLISLADLHIGKTQKPDYLDKVKDSVAMALHAISSAGIEEILILNTGDFFHTDSSKGMTTAGTQVEFEESFESSFSTGLDFISSIIEMCIPHALKVTFVNVRGNHSFDTEYCMGEALKRIYKKDASIQIINSQDNRIYYYWENNAFLFTHGDKALDRLPLTFATEGGNVFSKAENRHILLGHMHHSRSKQFINDKGEYNGIEVRVLGSPTATDRWHNFEGFVENKKCLISMIFTPEHGKFGEFNYKI